MELTAEDLPAVQMVLDLPENEELLTLVECVRAALKVGLESEYPIRDARQLENFLLEIRHDCAWFEERFAEFLPIVNKADFIKKARVAVHQVITLERPRRGPRREKI